MNLKLNLATACTAILLSLPALAEPRSNVLIPESAGYSAHDRYTRSHTRLRVMIVPDNRASTISEFNTPAQLRALYNLPSTGGSQAIAIVDAYHYPTAQADFNTFSNSFGLPTETSTNSTASANAKFQVVYASGRKPQSGGNYIASWNMEEALDIEWAHAMAPGAKIYLVEAASDSNNDLDNAVAVASGLPGVKEVSMSWGGGESPYETWAYDPLFTAAGVVYLASGGDSSDEMSYPAASPNVVSCGGTSVKRTADSVVESGWNDTGCGPSAFEARPSYQGGVAAVVKTKRGVSDLAFDADPNTGVYVYDSTPEWGESGWWILGGTSVSSPSLAGVLNLAATAGSGFASSSTVELNRIYSGLGNASAFRDIITGSDGVYRCAAGYDFVTGVGVVNGLSGK